MTFPSKFGGAYYTSVRIIFEFLRYIDVGIEATTCAHSANTIQ